MIKLANHRRVKEVLNETAADQLRGPEPVIPHLTVDRTAQAFEVAKEMLIEHIKELEFNDMTGGRIGRIVHNG